MSPPPPAPAQMHGHEVNPFERSFASPPPSAPSTNHQQGRVAPSLGPHQLQQPGTSQADNNSDQNSSDQQRSLPPLPAPDVDDVDPRLPGIPPPEVLERLQKHPDHSPKPSLPGMKHISPSLNLPDDLDRFKNWASLAEKWGQPGQGTPLSPGSLLSLSLAAPQLRSGGNTPSGLSRVLPAVSSGSPPGSNSLSPPRSAFAGGPSAHATTSMHSSPALGLRPVDPVNSGQQSAVSGPFPPGKPKIPLPAHRQPNSSSSSLFQIASQIPTPTPIYTSLAARSSAPPSAVHSEVSNDSAAQQDSTSSPPVKSPSDKGSLMGYMSPAQGHSRLSAAPSPALLAVSSPAQAPVTPLFHATPIKQVPNAVQPPVSMHQQPPPSEYPMMPHSSVPYPPFGQYPNPPTLPNGGPMHFASLQQPLHMPFATHHAHPLPPPYMHQQYQQRQQPAARSESLTPAPGTPIHPPTPAPGHSNAMSMSPAPTTSVAQSPMPAPSMAPPQQHQQTYNEQGFAHYQQRPHQHDLSDLPPGFLGQSHGPTDITRLGVEHIPVIPPQKKGNTKRKVDYDALDDKRKEFLERNRKAAMKCRQRKKQQLTLMETKAQGFTIHNEQLEAQLVVFRNEIDRLQAALRLANAAHCAPAAMAALAVPPPPPTAAVYTDPAGTSSVSPAPGTPVLGPAGQAEPAGESPMPLLNAH